GGAPSQQRADELDAEVPSEQRANHRADGARSLLQSQRVRKQGARRLLGIERWQGKPRRPWGAFFVRGLAALSAVAEGHGAGDREEDGRAEPQADGEHMKGFAELKHGGGILDAVFGALE